MNVVMELTTQPRVGPPTVPVADLPPPTEGEADFANLTAWWADNVLAPFLIPGHTLPDDHLELTAELLGQQERFDVRVNGYFLEDLTTAYGTFGWKAVELVHSTLVAKARDWPVEVFELYLQTRNVLELMIGQALVRIERRAAAHAKTAWEKARKKLLGYIANFHPPLEGWKTLGVRFKSAETQASLLKHCHAYAVASAAAVRLGEQAAARDRKRPSRDRKKGDGFDLWYQLYATAQEAEIKKMYDAYTEVHKVFPPAVLILDELPDWMGAESKPKTAPFELAILIYVRLQQLVGELELLESTLQKAPDTEWITFEYAKPTRSIKVSATSSEGRTVEGTTLAIALGKGRRELGVLANPYLLADLAEQDPGGAWDRIVLLRYRALLAAELDRQRQSQMAWARFWDVIGRVVAALSLLSLFALLPAAAAAAGTALAIVGQAANAIGLVMVVLHGVVGTLEEASALEARAREHLFRLSRDDPDALREIGTLLARSNAMRKALGEGLLGALVRIGLARFKILAEALEIDDALDDLETLFGPASEPQEG